jgi:hypothetical protein
VLPPTHWILTRGIPPVTRAGAVRLQRDDDVEPHNASGGVRSRERLRDLEVLVAHGVDRRDCLLVGVDAGRASDALDADEHSDNRSLSGVKPPGLPCT